MKLAVLSDLHLAPGASNRCTASPGVLLALFDQLEAAADRVLVGGDLFDLDRPRRPTAWRRQLATIRREFPRVTARLDDYEWIFGNHDGPLCRLGVPEEREYRADGLAILACHGHQWDMPLKKLPGLASSANFVAGWLHRTGLDGVASGMGGVPLVLDRLWHARSPKGSGSAQTDRSLRGATKLLADSDFDVLICGHSHRLRLVDTPGGLFVNTGSLCRGWIDWVLVDTKEQRVVAYRDGRVFEEAQVD